jgi:hypothetical protein
MKPSPPKKNRAKIWKKAACTIKTYFEVQMVYFQEVVSCIFMLWVIPI